MIKVTVNKKKVDEDIKYPCLMEGANEGANEGDIVLALSAHFDGRAKGIFIKPENSTGKLCEINLAYWKPFHGKITLEQ